jgi:hypothetical protein
MGFGCTGEGAGGLGTIGPGAGGLGVGGSMGFGCTGWGCGVGLTGRLGGKSGRLG